MIVYKDYFSVNRISIISNSKKKKVEMFKLIALFKEKNISNFVYIWKPFLGFVFVRGKKQNFGLGFADQIGLLSQKWLVYIIESKRLRL